MSDFQDDEREEYAIELFELEKDSDEGRWWIDAHLTIGNSRFPFELKSTSTWSVTTVRDFGLDHIEKWKWKHWLISVYNDGELYFLYWSPKRMAPWILEKEAYISPDLKICEIANKNFSLNDLYSILWEKTKYSLDDARKLHKKQYKINEYKNMMDLENGYSPNKMLKILKDRASYIMKRWSTLNNPHIPKSYFKDWFRIESNHSEVLRSMVLEEL